MNKKMDKKETKQAFKSYSERLNNGSIYSSDSKDSMMHEVYDYDQSIGYDYKLLSTTIEEIEVASPSSAKKKMKKTNHHLHNWCILILHYHYYYN
jgi:hypothetical protein